MKIEDCLNVVSSKFAVIGVAFLEEGYEVRLKPKCLEEEPEESAQTLFDEVEHFCKDMGEGRFYLYDIRYESKVFTLLLVPICIRDMMDYIYTYVEKFAENKFKLEDAFGDAFGVLEEMVNKTNLESAKVAYDKCVSII